MLRRSPPGLTQGVTPPDAAPANDQNIQMVAAICIQLNEHYIAGVMGSWGHVMAL